MHPIFGNFDFSLLGDADFREDSVREVVVVPLLHFLGYSASAPHKILRSKRLQHPFVYIGSMRKEISIIPDYLLQRDSQNAWILDAKGPREDIHTGKNVEQAYSYAIHRDVRVPLFALCNGHRLTVYHISHWPAILDIDLKNPGDQLGKLFSLLSTRAAWPGGIRPGFCPDLGIALKMSGFDVQRGQKIVQVFVSLRVISIAKIDDSTFSVNAFCGLPEDGEFILTLDFPRGVYNQLLTVLTPTMAEEVATAVSMQPFIFDVPRDSAFFLGAVAELGDTVHSNEDESYCPFIASRFIGPEAI
jgi:hypothetical protein